MINLQKSEFVTKIKKEVSFFTKNETYINSNDPLGILIHDIFQVSAHTRYGGGTEEIDRRVRSTIKKQISHLENMIVELAIKYEAVILEHHNKIIDPQRFIDYIQREAEDLSYELYDEDQIDILRNFHIYYLTYVKASNSLVKARISKAHTDIKSIVKDQKVRGEATSIYDDYDDE